MRYVERFHEPGNKKWNSTSSTSTDSIAHCNIIMVLNKVPEFITSSEMDPLIRFLIIKNIIFIPTNTLLFYLILAFVLVLMLHSFFSPIPCNFFIWFHELLYVLFQTIKKKSRFLYNQYLLFCTHFLFHWCLFRYPNVFILICISLHLVTDNNYLHIFFI